MSGTAAALAGLAALILIAGHAQAAGAVPAWKTTKDGEFLVIDTPHYQIKTDYLANVAQLVATHQEALFEELRRRLAGVKAAGTICKLPIVLVSTYRKYLELTGPSGINSQGMYTGDKILAWGPPDAVDASLETLRHECAHQFVDQFVGRKCPIWLHEGLAEFFKNGQFRDGQLLVGQAQMFAVNGLKLALARNQIVPPSRLMGMSQSEWLALVYDDPATAELCYDEAWVVVHFLQGAGGGKYRGPFIHYLNLLSQGQTPANAWSQVFGASKANLDSRFREYLKDLEATSGDCRLNLRLLGYILASTEGAKALAGDLAALRRALVEGKLGKWRIPISRGVALDSLDTETLKAIFRCPEDKSSGDRPSYGLVWRAKGARPILRCRHHSGFTLETVYDKDAEGDLTGLRVVSRLRARPTGAPAAAVWVDLLAMIDPARDAVKGAWERRGSSVEQTSTDEHARLMIPAVVSGGYELQVTFVRASGNDHVVFMLPVGSRQVEVSLGTAGGKAMFYSVEGGTVGVPCVVENGREYDLHVQVVLEGEKASLDVFLDGSPLLAWEGPQSALALGEWWQLPTPTCLGLGANKCQVVFKRVRLSMTSGKPVPLHGSAKTGAAGADAAAGAAKKPPDLPLVPAESWIDVLALADPKRDAVMGTWERRAAGLALTQPVGADRLMIPIAPQGNYVLQVKFVRLSGNETVFFALPVASGQAALSLSSWGGGAFLLVDREIRPGRLENGREYEVEIKVMIEDDKATIDVTLEGKPLIAWKGLLSSLTYPSDWRLPQQGCIGLGGWQVPLVFKSARLRMLSGKAQVLVPAAAIP